MSEVFYHFISRYVPLSSPIYNHLKYFLYRHLGLCQTVLIFASCSKSNLENSREVKTCYIHPYFCLLCFFSSLCSKIPVKKIISFLFKEVPVSSFLKSRQQILFTWDWLSLRHLKRNEPLFLLHVEFWSSFPSALETFCASSFWAPWFRIRNLLSFKLLFPCRKGVIFLWLLLRFFFSVFSFQDFNYNVSWHGFLWVYPLWVCWTSRACRFICPLPNLGNFNLLFLQVVSHSIIFPLSFWDSGDINVISVVVVQ